MANQILSLTVKMMVTQTWIEMVFLRLGCDLEKLT